MFFTAVKTVFASMYLGILNLFYPKGAASMGLKIMSQGSNIPWSWGSAKIALHPTFGFKEVTRSFSTNCLLYLLSLSFDASPDHTSFCFIVRFITKLVVQVSFASNIQELYKAFNFSLNTSLGTYKSSYSKLNFGDYV